MDDEAAMVGGRNHQHATQVRNVGAVQVVGVFALLLFEVLMCLVFAATARIQK